ELKALRERHGKAETKERLQASAAKAEAQANAAKNEAKAGPSEASMIATVIARQMNGNANNVARYIALSLTGLIIAVTQLVALLGGQAATLITRGLKIRHVKRAAQEQKTGPGTPRRKKVTKAGTNVIRLAARTSVERWLETT